jgi:hypothetical protein
MGVAGVDGDRQSVRIEAVDHYAPPRRIHVLDVFDHQRDT